MYILKTLYIVLVPFFLMLCNGSYEKNEDFFHANQAKDSSAGPRRFCILFLFFKFLQPWHVFSLLRDPARVRCQEAQAAPWRLPRGGCVICVPVV